MWDIWRLQRKLRNSKYRPKPFYLEFEQWIIDNKSDLNEKTLKSYLNTKDKIFEYFGNDLLNKIDKNMYQKFLETFDYLTVETNKKMHKQIRSFVKSSFESNLIYSNFTNDVKIRGKESPYRKKYLTIDEYNRFAKSLIHKQMNLQEKTMIFLALNTGIRYGELCAVTWEDIDFANQKIRIHRQWDYVKGSGFKSLKARISNSSKAEDINERHIPLNNQLTKILLEFKKSNDYLPNDKERLFYKNDCAGYVMSNNTFNNKLEQHLADAKIERVTAHALRHSFGTYLVSKGTSKDYIQYLLGHKDYRTTEQYYIHLHEEMFKKHANDLINIEF